MRHEQKILTIFYQAYKNKLKGSYKEIEAKKELKTTFQNIKVMLNKIVVVEGEGIILKEYYITTLKKINLSSNDFLKSQEFSKSVFSNNPIGIGLLTFTLKTGETTKIYIAENNHVSPNDIDIK